jgi:hypothetical protein
MLYLTMLLVAQAIQRPVIGWNVINKLGGQWTEVGVAYFKLLSEQLLRMIGENYWKSYSG